MLNDIYESSSNWLKATDLKGHKPVVTIESAEVRENNYNGEKKKQIVLKFVGKDKLFGLNFTNASMIANLTGTEDFNLWIGQSIRLYEDRTKNAQGAIVPCIRIFPDLPEMTAAPAPPPPTAGFNPAQDQEEDIPW